MSKKDKATDCEQRADQPNAGKKHVADQKKWGLIAQPVRAHA